MIISVLILSLILPFSSAAVEITLSKQSYQPQETLQAEILTAESLAKSDILLYKQETPRPMPVEFDLILKNSKYYLYMVLPNQEGSFYLTVKGTKVKDFNVTQTSPALTINKGFILATEDFTIIVKSLYGSQDVNAKFGSQSYDFLLIQDMQEQLEFSIAGMPTQTTSLTINDYTIPVFIINDIPIEEPEEPEECIANCTNKSCGDDGCGGSCGSCWFGWCDNSKCISDAEDCQDECSENELKCFGNYSKVCNNFDEDSCFEWGNETLCEYGCQNKTCINITEIIPVVNNSIELKFKSSLDSELPRLSAFILFGKSPLQIILKNTGIKNLTNIKLSSNLEVEITPDDIDLKSGEEKLINLIFNIGKGDVDSKNRIAGNLTAKVNDNTFDLPLYLVLTENQSQVTTSSQASQSYSCSDMNGEKCGAEEECDISTVSSLDGSCCLGNCDSTKSTSKWLIGLFIILILFLIAGVVFLRAKRNPRGSPKDLLDKKTYEFQNRMSGKEVNRSLGKI